MRYEEMLSKAQSRTVGSAIMLAIVIRASIDAERIEDVPYRILAFGGIGVLVYVAMFLAVSASVYRTCAAMHLAKELKIQKETGLR